jgi:hypothetical protein
MIRQYTLLIENPRTGATSWLVMTGRSLKEVISTVEGFFDWKVWGHHYYPEEVE